MSESVRKLRRDIEDALADINKQIEIIEEDATRRGLRARQLQDRNGNYLMTPLITARTQLLLAQTMLEVNCA